MNTWPKFLKYVKSNYKVMEETDKMCKMGFNLDGGRSQIVLLHLLKIDDAEFVQVESPVGDFTPQAAAAVVRESENMIIGGVGCFGDLITFRHTVPLANLDANEFEVPLLAVVVTADRLEKTVIGGDKF